MIAWARELVGAAALVGTAVLVVPQTVRMIRVRSTAGVSAVWAMLGVVSTGAWTAYAGGRGLWWVMTADALACVGYLSSVYVLAQHGSSPDLAAGGAWLAVFTAAYLAAGLDGVGAVLSVAFVVQVAPSLWTAYRRSDLNGASALTWGMTMVEGALWFTYGTLVYDNAVTIYETCQ